MVVIAANVKAADVKNVFCLFVCLFVSCGLHQKRMTRLGRSPFRPSQLFVSHVNGSPSFVRKYRKSWLAQGSSGSRVTLLLGTTFLHINGALGLTFQFQLQKIFCYVVSDLFPT